MAHNLNNSVYPCILVDLGGGVGRLVFIGILEGEGTLEGAVVLLVVVVGLPPFAVVDLVVLVDGGGLVCVARVVVVLLVVVVDLG